MGSKYKPQSLQRVIGYDTREQRPWGWQGIKTKKVTMKQGDYCLLSEAGNQLGHLLTIERKSLNDIIGCMMKGRERFERELERLQKQCIKSVVVIEAGLHTLLDPNSYRSNITPQSIVGSVASWSLDFPKVGFLWAGDRELAMRYVYRMFLALERRLDKPRFPCEQGPYFEHDLLAWGFR